MKYLFYVDLKTVRCDQNTIEKLISENSDNHIRISDSLWGLDVYEHSFCWEFQGVPEYYIMTLFDKYLDDHSICFIHEVDLELCHSYYNLPKKALSFLFGNGE